MMIKAWHFMPPDKRLTNGDGRQIRRGSVTRIEGTPRLCKHGLHGSRNILDALRYAPGPILCRVEHSGVIVEGDDKLCSTERRCLWWIDATDILHEFACWCAERALRRAGITDERCWAAIEAKRAWMRGEIDDDVLAATRTAASAAARDAASDAAWAATRTAASAAARDAASAAARDATRDAAKGAAWGAAWDAECKAQARKLVRMATGIECSASGCGTSASGSEKGNTGEDDE